MALTVPMAALPQALVPAPSLALIRKDLFVAGCRRPVFLAEN
jgi:hypothetical protein